MRKWLWRHPRLTPWLFDHIGRVALMVALGLTAAVMVGLVILGDSLYVVLLVGGISWLLHQALRDVLR